MSIVAWRRGGVSPPSLTPAPSLTSSLSFARLLFAWLSFGRLPFGQLFQKGRGTLPLRGLCLFVLLAVRLAALDADPPPWLSWSTGLYTDEGFYTLDARHEALFGTPAPGNFHDRLLSPLLSLMQQDVFTVFGAGLVQGRLVSVVFGMLTVAVFWLGLRRAYDARTADLGALFLGLAPPFVLYNRLALQETPTVFWLALGFALWAHSGRRSKFGAGCAIALAVVFKGLALVFMPVLWIQEPTPQQSATLLRGEGEEFRTIISSSSRFGRTPAKSLVTMQGGGFLLIMAFYILLWYGPHQAELARTAEFYRVHQMQPHSLLSVWLNVRRGLISGEHGVVPYLQVLLPVPVLLVGWGMWKRRAWMQADKYLAVWLGCGLLFCLLSSYAPSRYYVLFLPPLAGLAARRLTEWKRPALLAAIGGFLLTSSGWYGAAWVGRTYAGRDVSRAMAQLLPPGSIVAGEFAPTLCLGTPFAAAPVQPGLSNDRHPAERLRATQIAVTRTVFWENWWRSRYPSVIQPSHRIATFTLGGSRGYVIDLYDVGRQDVRRAGK